MTLFKEWQDLIGNQSKSTFKKFWDEYSEAEIKIYKDVLSNSDHAIVGSFKDISEKFQVSDVLLMGFLDGVNTSLNKPLDEKALESVSQETELDIQIDPEKLYFNMLKAKADHLHTLPEWESVLTEDRRAEITKEFKRSQTVVKGPQTGRNEPCPCGSGKKYKKCCGA